MCKTWLYSILLGCSLPSSCMWICGVLISRWQSNCVYSVYNDTLDCDLFLSQQFCLVHRRLWFTHVNAEVDNPDLFCFCLLIRMMVLSIYLVFSFTDPLSSVLSVWLLCRGVSSPGKQLVQGQKMAELGLTLVEWRPEPVLLATSLCTSPC